MAPAKQPNTMYFRSQKASKTQPLTSLSEDLKTMYSQAPKASSWGTCETAKHHVFQVPKGVKIPASNVTFWRPKDNVQSSTQSLVLGHLQPRPGAPAKQPNTMYFRSQKAPKTQPLTSLSEDLKAMYSQAPKASSWGTCETAKHHVFQVPKGVKNPASNVTFWRPKDNVQSSTQSLVLGHLQPRPGAPAKQQNTMYFRSQKASKTQPLTSLSEDLKTMYSQAPKASSWGTCETAKHHVFQVPKGVKNPASNVTFWRPKGNVQSSTQSLVLGHLRNSQTP